MQKVTLFHFEGCPYCREARRLLSELIRENPRFAQLEIELIDEKLHPEIAEKFDYWYVPTFFVGNKKAHEGPCAKKDVEDVLLEAAEMA